MDTAAATIVGMVWVDGVLHVRWRAPVTDDTGRPVSLRRDGDRMVRLTPEGAVERDVTDELRRASATLVLRAVRGRGDHALPTTSSTRFVPAEGSAGAEIAVLDAESRLDPRRAAAGMRLRHGQWKVYGRISALGSRTETPARADVAARPALVGALPVVARPDEDGGLSVDVGGNPLSVDTTRPRVRAATVTTTGPHRIEIALPLDGVRTHRKAHLVGAVDVRPQPATLPHRALTSARRRLARKTIRPGDARLVTHGDDVTLACAVDVIPGTWRLAFTFGGNRSPSRLVLTVPHQGSPSLAELPGAPAPPTEPRVSVVIPVHNGGRHLEPAIRSVFEQTLPPEEVEIITVDDGSTDDSLATLRRLEREHPGMRVIATEASGSASRPRNLALDVARGRHVFFLDADDRLTPYALEKLTDVADALGADVAIGRMLGINRKRPSRAAFRRTALDADLVENSLFGAMTPHKLFRRAHLEERGLRFAEDIRIGEDVLLVAEAELTARRIVILADTVYYEWYNHDDGHVHLSRTGQPPEQVFEKASRLAALVERYVEPGPRRNLLLHRSLGYALNLTQRVVRRKDPATAAKMVKRVKARFGPLWSEELRDSLGDELRPGLTLLFEGDTDDVLYNILAPPPDGRVRRAAAHGGARPGV